MENVLEWYAADPQPGVARLTFDEKPCQLLGDTIEPIAAKPGSVKKVDHEYTRHGVANVLLAYDRDEGIRHVKISKQRTKRDFADYICNLMTEHYSEATRVDILLDNLNTHCYGSFYDHLSIQQAEMLRRKVRFIFTPKHGSWLNMTEIEFSAFAKQCLGKRRISSMEELEMEEQAWTRRRNNQRVRINWTFTTAKAREKFSRHYAKLNATANETSESDH